MADDTQALLAEAQALHAKKSPAPVNAEPGVQAIGTTDNGEAALLAKAQMLHKQASTGKPAQSAIDPDTLPENADWVDKAAYYANKAVPYGEKAWAAAKKVHPALNVGELAAQGVSRVMDYPAGVITTALAHGAGAMKSGENPVGWDDWARTAIGDAPGLGDQSVKLGINDPNDGFAIPGTNNKKLSARAIENFLGKIALNPFSYAGFRERLGAGMYNRAISPIEIEGERMSKSEMGKRMRKMEISNPLTMNERAQEIMDAKMAANAEIETQATKAGGVVDMQQSMEGPQRFVDYLKGSALPGDLTLGVPDSPELLLARKLQHEIDRHNMRSPGGVVLKQKPEVPIYQANTQKIETPLEGMTKIPEQANGKLLYGPNGTDGRPLAGAGEMTPVINNETDVIRSLPVQGDTVPAPTVSTSEAVPLKQQAYQKAKQSYDSERKHTAEGSYFKTQGAGLKEGIERSIEQTLGTGTKEVYSENNADVGSLLSTTKARARVQNQNTRLANSVTSPSPTGTEGAVGALVAALQENGGAMSALKAMALQKAFKGWQLATMPTGYYLNRSANSVMPTGAISGNAALTAGPWAIKGDDDGKK